MMWSRNKNRRANGVLSSQIALALICAVPMLEAAPAQASSSAQASDPVNPVFMPILAQLRHSHQSITVLLPVIIARQQQYGLLTPELGANRAGYTITLSSMQSRQEHREHSNHVDWVCMVHGQSLLTKNYPYPDPGKRVALAGGITGWYTAPDVEKGGVFGTLGWQYKSGQYSMGITHGTQAELVAMANSAIQHPARPR